MIWLEGCGAGILLMLRDLWLHISPYHADRYHRFLPMNTVFGGVAIDLILACLLCTGALWLLGRFDGEGETVLWAAFAIILVIQTSGFVGWIAAQSGCSAGFIAVLTGVTLACIAAGPLLWLWRRSWYGKRAVPLFRGSLAVMGFCIVWVLPQLAYMAVRPEPHDVHKFVRTISPARVPQRRIVWILFDGLSQDQAFDHRQADISLPELDNFRAQSVMFADMQPAGFYTEEVIPSLLWGKIVTNERADLSGNLFVKALHQWQPFPVGQTLFADARRSGWSTGAAGWYNPYCRTYAQSLDWCGWVLRFGMPGNYSPERSLLWNVTAPLIRDNLPDAVAHANDYNDLMRWSRELIDDEKIGFVFLHLPLPHPLGFYDRKTGRLGVSGGSYLDSLVLSDRSLGELMQWIGETSLASKTTVIVCSDHSWRVPIWHSSFTKEDESASGGKFDPRPVLMVHFPQETTAETVSKPFPAIREHALVESLLHDAMSAEQLKAWAGKE